ncbi:MAG TPA: SWIM zinc finger family protein [Bryobacteraceae bacterium]|nr:SWIM zinc finger family protein [Bryobacteraceae bacterium]
MSVAAQVVDPQSASLALTLLQSKAGNRWARAVEEMKANRLRVAGDFPEFIVTNKSGTAYKVKLDPHGSGSCTCPDFLVRIAQEGRICKHIAAAAITALAPHAAISSPKNGNGAVLVNETATAEASPLIFRIRRNLQSDGKNGTVIEVQARVTNDEVQDQETASYAYGLLDRLASLAGKNTAPSDNNARAIVPPSTAKTKPIKSHATSATEGGPVHAVITKIDRMKTRQGDSLFLKVDVGGETVRVFGRPEELAERLEASGYDIPASEIEAGMELHLPCLVKVGQGKNGYKNIEEFLPETAE